MTFTKVYLQAKNPGKTDCVYTALKPIRNKYHEEIKRICEANNIKLIAVVKGLDYFQKVNAIYPEIHNYENVVQGEPVFLLVRPYE